MKLKILSVLSCHSSSNLSYTQVLCKVSVSYSRTQLDTHDWTLTILQVQLYIHYYPNYTFTFRQIFDTKNYTLKMIYTQFEEKISYKT